MTKSNLPTQISLSTPRQQTHRPHKTSSQYLMNESLQACDMMEVVNEETEDAEMADQAMMSTSTTPMRSSTHLAAKLKKLMEMELALVLMMIGTEIQAMEINDLKKRAQVPTSLTGTKSPATTGTQIQPLEINKHAMTKHHHKQLLNTRPETHKMCSGHGRNGKGNCGR